jgi:hypothetical protein
MKIEVPVFNEDGSVKFTATLSEAQAAVLLQFAINLSMATGIAAHLGIIGPELDDTGNVTLND